MWMDVLTSRDNIKSISLSLPILLLNGAEDPVGSMGKETIKAQKIYQKHGLNCKLIQYKGMRHEILNEKEKKKIEDNILSFIEKHL
jgi:alpha-beta hydrolase superfamily lysophospholipase